jgi:hypothetical protein
MPQTTWPEQQVRPARAQPARRPPRAAQKLPAALCEPVAVPKVDKAPEPRRVGPLGRHRVAIALVTGLACLYAAPRALDLSLPTPPFGSDPIPSDASSAVASASSPSALNAERRVLASLARLAALDRSAAPTRTRGDRSGKPSGGGSGGSPGGGGSDGPGGGSGNQPGTDQPLGLLSQLPAPVPSVDPDDLPQLDPAGVLPQLPPVAVPELDPSLPTVESPTELP